MQSDGDMCLIAAKFVDFVLVTDEEEVVETFISDFNNRFIIGTGIHGPGRLRFFGTNIVQEDSMNCHIDTDGKLPVL